MARRKRISKWAWGEESRYGGGFRHSRFRREVPFGTAPEDPERRRSRPGPFRLLKGGRELRLTRAQQVLGVASLLLLAALAFVLALELLR
ncbi:MAG: hypothetical protein AAF581_11480 [Planctomycetota bacterium]